MKKADIIRLQNVESTVQRFREKILEFVQIDICKQMLESLGDRTKIDQHIAKVKVKAVPQKNYISCVYTHPNETCDHKS